MDLVLSIFRMWVCKREFIIFYLTHQDLFSIEEITGIILKIENINLQVR